MHNTQYSSLNNVFKYVEEKKLSPLISNGLTIYSIHPVQSSATEQTHFHFDVFNHNFPPSNDRYVIYGNPLNTCFLGKVDASTKTNIEVLQFHIRRGSSSVESSSNMFRMFYVRF